MIPTIIKPPIKLLKSLTNLKKKRKSLPIILPPKIGCEIISHIYDVNTLRICSTICRLWHSIVKHRLHYSLTLHCQPGTQPGVSLQPLQTLFELKLLPLVKEFHYESSGTPPEFTLEHLDYKNNLRNFSKLKHLRGLSITDLQLSSFIPVIQKYFGHFLQALQSLSLTRPNATCREILYFIGLFPNLRDFKLCDFGFIGETKASTGLTIHKAPLKGSLVLDLVLSPFLEVMITLYRDLRFCYVSLCRVQGTQLVLDACRETLQTLKLDPNCKCENCLWMKREGLKLKIHSRPTRSQNYVRAPVPPDPRTPCP